MLNKNNIRELAYVVIVDNVTPIEGYDRVELAHVSGWTIVVGKGEFHPGDPAIYFEIDSKLPEVEPFTNMEFLKSKHYKIKTQKMCKCISQGLLMSAANFGWTIGYDTADSSGDVPYIIDNKNEHHYAGGESRFLTAELGVTYADPGDNQRKAKSTDKYKSMAQRHGKLFAKQPFRFLMKHIWGKKLLFLFFGRKKDKKNDWPAWVVKTDEERVQNMPWILEDKSEWIATEKIDGTSTTFTMKRGKGFRKNQFFICSRNVVFDTPEKVNKCYYDSNVYLEMAEKYHIKDVLERILYEYPMAEWVTIQGETYGNKIQNRDYGLKDHKFMAFNLIMSHKGRWNSVDMSKYLSNFDIPCVPILSSSYILPDTVEDILKEATGKSQIDGNMREGIVFRSQDGTKSFKAVSNEYLLKYHG